MTNPLDLLALIADSGLPAMPETPGIDSLMPGESGGIPESYAGPGQRIPIGGRRVPTPRIPPTPKAPKPRAARGGSGIDFNTLDLGELLFLTLHPSGPQIISMMSNAQQQKQDREIQKQQMEAQRQQMERANQMQDLNTRMVLGDRGAMEVEPGVKGDFRAALSGGQKVVETPVGRFVLPTVEKERERAYSAFLAQEELKARSAANTAARVASARAAQEPKVPLAPDLIDFFKLGWAKELPRSAVDAMVRQYNAVKPKDSIRIISNNDGTLSVARANATETSVETVKGGPTRPETKESAGGLTPYQEYQKARSSKKDAADAIKHAQELINTARAKDVDKTPKGDPTTDAEWQAARIAVEQAVTQYPDQIEAGTDANGYPYIKPKTGVAGTTPGTATTRSASSPQSITRSQYNQAVKDLGKAVADAEVRRRNLTIIE